MTLITDMDYEIIAPRNGVFDDFTPKGTLPFEDITLDFVDVLSKTILNNSKAKSFPELIALAYWMRRANIVKLKDEFYKTTPDALFLSRGNAFHIAPSNVDTIFVYSWILSLLSGNANIVRISRKSNRQLDILVDFVNLLLEKVEFKNIRSRNLIVRYNHDDSITGHFSKLADVRIIWGGDETVEKIRKIAVKPSAVELSFSNKFSFCVIKSSALVQTKADELCRVASNFYNDSYLFDQLACSSPRLVIWIGNEEENQMARELFWGSLQEKLQKENIIINPVHIIDKIVSKYSFAIQDNHSSRNIPSKKYNLDRIEIQKLSSFIRQCHSGHGLFYEYLAQSLNDISSFIDKNDQTMGIFGFSKEEIITFLKYNKIHGITRITSIGKALEFSNIWDGYNLLRSFTREVAFQL